MYGRQALIDKIKLYDPSIDLAVINKALDVAFKYHGPQTRASGEPYIIHPIAVAEMIVEMRLDTASIVTGLLHDTVEDTELTLEEIEKLFDKDIANLVNGVTKLTRIEFQPENVRQAENFRKLLIAMSEDIRVLLVKLADRLHNMRTIDFITSSAKRQRIALETMEIYAPLAERIGMHQYKTELQDISFKILYPRIRESILERLNEIAENGQELIEQIIYEIENHLLVNGIQAKVSGRQKTPYSIWMKMNQKNVSFDQLSDIIAFRVVVKNLSECYQSLGIIHSNYKMVPENFQDFISTPKNNGYQSIHTVVIGPLQQRIEVQIRTEEMHEVAELGVAAHWSYKQKYNAPDGKQFRWIRELLQILDHATDSEEFLQNTKLEMYYDQVFCFTPQGKLIPLPRGATPIDFAYAVHSEVGNHCSGAKVNGQIATLKTQLKNGDQVEIITSKNQTPNPSWEDFAVTGKARSEIRKFTRLQRWQQYINLGNNILDKAFKTANIEANEESLLAAAKKFGKKSVDELYFAIGEGTVNRDEVIKIFKPVVSKFSKPFSLFNLKKQKEDKSSLVSIKGLIPGMAVHYAGCCHPIPGDKIVGIIHTGKGITIHTEDCDHLAHLNRKDFDPIKLGWENDTAQQSYTVRLLATLLNEPGSLAVLTAEIAKDKSNITNFKIINRSSDLFEVLLDVEVKNTGHLTAILSSLKIKREIQSVERFKP